MDKLTYIKYKKLIKNKDLYFKIQNIKSIHEQIIFINSLYYKICDTLFLKKSGLNYSIRAYHFYEYRILIYFNLYNFYYYISLIKITKEDSIIINKYSLLDYELIDISSFNINFMIDKIANIILDENQLEVIPILIKCRIRMENERNYIITLIKNTYFFLSLPEDISVHILQYLIGIPLNPLLINKSKYM
jgi:hypothetical protein